MRRWFDAGTSVGRAWGRGEVYVRETLWGRRLLVPDRFIFPVAILFSKPDESSHAARPSLALRRLRPRTVSSRLSTAPFPDGLS